MTRAESVGLGTLTFASSFTPCVEIGWRVARPYWGCGYAAEAARVHHSRRPFTTPANVPSIRVIEKLGMRYAGEFAHPALPQRHRLRTHVLYVVDSDGSSLQPPPCPFRPEPASSGPNLLLPARTGLTPLAAIRETRKYRNKEV